MKKRVVLSTCCGILGAGNADVMARGCAVAPLPSASVADTWWVFHGYVEAGGRFFSTIRRRTVSPAKGGQAALANTMSTATLSRARSGILAQRATKTASITSTSGATTSATTTSDTKLTGRRPASTISTLSGTRRRHIYSTNAQTIYTAVSAGPVRLPPGLSNTLFDDAGCTNVADRQPAGCASGNPTAAQRAAYRRDITNNLYTTDIGIRRDTAAVLSAGRRPTPGTSTSIIRTCTAGARRSTALSFRRDIRRHSASAEAGRRHDPKFRSERRIQGHFALGQALYLQGWLRRLGLFEDELLTHNPLCNSRFLRYRSGSGICARTALPPARSR